MSNSSHKKPDYIAYQVIERKDDRPYWSNVGAAWRCGDDSIMLKLNAMPFDGIVNLRAPKQKEAM